MAYTYTLTNEGQFNAKEFQENKSDIQLKNNGTVECNEIIEGFFNKTLPDDSCWTKIFYHNISAGLFSKNKKDAIDINDLETKSLDMYSQLHNLDTIAYKQGGKYEFILEFPSDLPGKYNRWQQKNNPFIPTNSNAGVTGYQGIHIDFTDCYWNGLEYNGFGSCLADGSSRQADVSEPITDTTGHENWFYAIGCTAWHNDGIPGPKGKASYSDIALWVRVASTTNFDKDLYFAKNNKLYCNEFIEE